MHDDISMKNKQPNVEKQSSRGEVRFVYSSSLFKSLVGLKRVCNCVLTSVTFSDTRPHTERLASCEPSVTCSHLPTTWSVWIRAKRAGPFRLWAGSTGEDEKEMWAWVKECRCKQTSFVVPVIQRASSQQLPVTPGPGLCF